jgi:hypothetical protein
LNPKNLPKRRKRLRIDLPPTPTNEKSHIETSKFWTGHLALSSKVFGQVRAENLVQSKLDCEYPCLCSANWNRD